MDNSGIHRRRIAKWLRAAESIERAGFPLTIAIHISWSACFAAAMTTVGTGIALRFSEDERVSLLWDRMRRIALRYGVPWIAMRAPEDDHQKGLHLHMAVHLPNAALDDVIRLIERLTGVPAEMKATSPMTITEHGRTTRGVWARGHLGAWLVQANLRPGRGGTAGFARYVTKAPKTPRTAAQFRLSNALIRIAGA